MFACDLLQGWGENNPKCEEMGERLLFVAQLEN